MRRVTIFVAVCLLSLKGLQAADNIQLGVNSNLFYVLAAINAAGYDEGVQLPDNSPLRKQLRDYLSKQDIKVLPQLQAYYRKHMQRNGVQDLSEYISYALSVTGPPDFAWRTRDVDVPPDAMALKEFTPLMIDFFQQARLDVLWERAKPVYEKEMARYHSPLLTMTTAVDGYLRVPAAGYLGRKFEVFIDLLAAPEIIETRNYGDDTFVIATPSEQPRTFDIRHAYLLFEIDPIVIKYGVLLDQKRSILDYVRTSPLDENFKNDMVLLSDESLVKAIEARLDKDPSEVSRAARQGFVLAPFFSEQLPIFEKQEQGMRYYFEEMANAIDLKREDTRIGGMKFDAAPLQRLGKQVTVEAPSPQLSPSGATLAQAEDLYLKRSLDAAKQLYLKSLEQTGSPAEHAQAWYGLARVSILQNQPEAAVKLFEKTLGASPDDQTKAWSLVYLARLARAAGEPEQAAKFYQDALGISGASEMARQAAQTELKNTSKK